MPQQQRKVTSLPQRYSCHLVNAFLRNGGPNDETYKRQGSLFITTTQTLSLRRALNFLRQSTVSCLCTADATRSRFYKQTDKLQMSTVQMWTWTWSRWKWVDTMLQVLVSSWHGYCVALKESTKQLLTFSENCTWWQTKHWKKSGYTVAPPVTWPPPPIQ